MIDTSWEMKQGPSPEEMKERATEAEHKQIEAPDTNIHTGLSSHEVKQRLEHYGYNEIAEEKVWYTIIDLGARAA